MHKRKLNDYIILSKFSQNEHFHQLINIDKVHNVLSVITNLVISNNSKT